MPRTAHPAGVQERVLREHALAPTRAVRMVLSAPCPGARPIYTVALTVPRANGGTISQQARYTPYRDRADEVFDALVAGAEVPPDWSRPRLSGRPGEVYAHWWTAVQASEALLRGAA